MIAEHIVASQLRAALPRAIRCGASYVSRYHRTKYMKSFAKIYRGQYTLPTSVERRRATRQDGAEVCRS